MFRVLELISYQVQYIYLINKKVQFQLQLSRAMNQSLLNQLGSLDASKHTLNNSGSKIRFSFPKAERFSQGRNKILCDHIYTIPTTRTIRTTSFGYGNKTIGLKTDRNQPQPATYRLLSQFQESKRGITFGEGRQKLQLGGLLRQSILRKHVPGPGNYESAYSTLNVPRISIRSRLADKSLDYLKKVPGPGAYNHEEIGTAKYYVSSKYQYTGGTRISPGRRLDPINRRSSVGPGSYDCKSAEMNAEGRYANSKFQNSKSRVFSKSKREDLVNKNQLVTPGPGNYSSFSTFG